MNLDMRAPSQEAYRALTEIAQELETTYYIRASSLVQELPSYIATWGLHRLAGDAQKYLQPRASEDTKYKGKIYRKFLGKLQSYSNIKFTADEPKTLLEMPLREYTALNRLAIELSREWSFWATHVLGVAAEQ
ncbi:hypothetical protein [Gloeobacter morelensis]|uniref:CRISPR type III-B/RAMP module-associated protein Cmr5 n=1 Tax=Gloeobacter morelensis MG652769 TaxID=2781736 RepID=A0ABY3PLW4_9CYAN|nr:hypothetical protein [Gloeobacter morelensis]UFP94658.1 hypothetical protein ISF26_23515 [Gloeobacter morelensis MG652769]